MSCAIDRHAVNLSTVRSSASGSIFDEASGLARDTPKVDELAAFGLWRDTSDLIRALHAARPADELHYRQQQTAAQPIVSLNPPSPASPTSVTWSNSSSPRTSRQRSSVLLSPAGASSPPGSPRTSSGGFGLIRRATRRPAPSLRTKSASDAPTPPPGLLPPREAQRTAKSWDPVASRPSSSTGVLAQDLVLGSGLGSTSASTVSSALAQAEPSGPRKLRKGTATQKAALRVRTDEDALRLVQGDKGAMMSSPESMTASSNLHAYPSYTRAKSPLGSAQPQGEHPKRSSNSSGDSYNADAESSSTRSNTRAPRLSLPATGSSGGWVKAFRRSASPASRRASGSQSSSLADWEFVQSDEGVKAPSKKGSFEVVYRGPEARVTQRRTSHPLLSSGSEGSLASIAKGDQPRRRPSQLSIDELAQINEASEQSSPASASNPAPAPTDADSNSPTPMPSPRVGHTALHPAVPPSTWPKRTHEWSTEPPSFTRSMSLDSSSLHRRPRRNSDGDDSFDLSSLAGDSSWLDGEDDGEETPASSADAGDTTAEDSDGEESPVVGRKAWDFAVQERKEAVEGQKTPTRTETLVE